MGEMLGICKQLMGVRKNDLSSSGLGWESRQNEDFSRVWAQLLGACLMGWCWQETMVAMGPYPFHPLAFKVSGVSSSNEDTSLCASTC